MNFRYLTAGESHGKTLLTIIEGIPSNLPLAKEDIDRELRRRQKGYGRGGRMRIEKDEVEILSGVRSGKTLGSPIGLLIKNKDWKNWKEIMATKKLSTLNSELSTVLTFPRPGHADLSGAIKYDFVDIRNVLERASARETAARVAVGAICKKFLKEFGINFYSRVIQIGGVADKKIKPLIDKAKKKGDSLGGIFEVTVINLPIGLGSYVQSDVRLDGKLAGALMSIPGIKGVEIGSGFDAAKRFGSEVQDEIFYERKKGFYRKTNRAGGLEGGMTNGEPLILRAAMKPISTLKKPLLSVDLISKKQTKAVKERADICAVPSAAVIGEAMAAIEITRAFLEKFGSDSISEIKRNYGSYRKYVKER